MITYFNFATPAKSEPFTKALLSSGYADSTTYTNADFFLLEKESSTHRRQEKILKIIKGKPVFMIPHTPYSFWLWDRWLEPMQVSCNFVNSPVSVIGMKAYGYPYRVEEIGWMRCEKKPFKKTYGNNLLYMPPSRLEWGFAHLGTLNDLDLHIKTINWIVQNRKHFGRVTLHYRQSMEHYKYDTLPQLGFEFHDMGSGPHQLSAQSALDGIEKADADLVISSNTAGYVALASGYPTVLFNNFKGAPITCATGGGWNWEKYKEHYEFPLTLLEMSIAEVLALRDEPNPEVEKWKKMNIGDSFDADKFISIVREYL